MQFMFSKSSCPKMIKSRLGLSVSIGHVRPLYSILFSIVSPMENDGVSTINFSQVVLIISNGQFLEGLMMISTIKIIL